LVKNLDMITMVWVKFTLISFNTNKSGENGTHLNHLYFSHITKNKHEKEHMKSSDAKASKCHLKFSSKILIFIKLVYLSSVISLKWQ